MKRIHLSLILSVALSIVLIGCGKSGALQEGTYYVQKIVDGDTLELSGGKKVRYIGIDTPETMKKVGESWVFQPESYGVAAKDFNRRSVSGREVKLEFDEDKKDKYGRLLAYIYIDGDMLNERMVREGYALVYTFPPNLRYYDLLIEAQIDARNNKRGFWASMPDMLPAQAYEHMGEFGRFKAVVSDVYVTPQKIYLYFGKDKNKYITAVIFARNIPLFTKEGIDPVTAYRGRYVEIVGKIEDRSYPEMIIDNPTQIKVLGDS